MIAIQHPIALPVHFHAGHYAPTSSFQHNFQFPAVPVVHNLPNPQYPSGRLARARDVVVPSIPLPPVASSALLESIADSPSSSPISAIRPQAIHKHQPPNPQFTNNNNNNIAFHTPPPSPTKRRSTTPRARRRNSYQGYPTPPHQKEFETGFFQQPSLVRSQTFPGAAPATRQSVPPPPQRSRTFSNTADFGFPLPQTPTHSRSPSAPSFPFYSEGERYANSTFQNSPSAKELPKPKFLS